LTARGLYVETARTFAQYAGFLFLVGAVVFIPMGLLDAAADRAGAIHVAHLGGLAHLAAGAVVAGLIAQAATSLLGEVFYSGAVAKTIAHGKRRGRLTLLGIARSLSYRRLIAVDVLFGLAVAIGLVLLVAPGVVAFTWFALAGPLVELEDARVRESLARSRRLVRGRFWTVLAVLGPITLASEAITDALLALGHGAIHNGFLGDWIAESVTNIGLSPLYAVAAVLITLELSRSDTRETRADAIASR
jgi:hypothetical protein